MKTIFIIQTQIAFYESVVEFMSGVKLVAMIAQGDFARAASCNTHEN